MRPSESPFPCRWWGTGLENAGLGDVRPDISTYGQYDFDRLPPLPFHLRGDFAWLADAPVQGGHIGKQKAAENAKAFVLLNESSARLGVPLPNAFTAFLSSPALHERIRSNTDCYLDLCPELLHSPVGGGYLVRFLSDSQGCVFWYLYVPPDALDHAVVSSPDFYGTDSEQWNEDPADPEDIAFSAESFEAFVCRFWLENEIWFAAYEKQPMPEIGRQYIVHYRGKST